MFGCTDCNNRFKVSDSFAMSLHQVSHRPKCQFNNLILIRPLFLRLHTQYRTLRSSSIIEVDSGSISMDSECLVFLAFRCFHSFFIIWIIHQSISQYISVIKYICIDWLDVPTGLSWNGLWSLNTRRRMSKTIKKKRIVRF